MKEILEYSSISFNNAEQYNYFCNFEDEPAVGKKIHDLIHDFCVMQGKVKQGGGSCSVVREAVKYVFVVNQCGRRGGSSRSPYAKVVVEQFC